MTYQADYAALAWSDAKTAALYFDHVVPANVMDVYRTDASDPIYSETLRSLLPESLRDATTKTGLAKIVTAYVAHFLIAFPEAAGVSELSTGETLEERRKAQLPVMLGAFADLVAQSKLDQLSIYGVALQASPGAAADPCLILSELDLVDTKAIPWRQILELRRDDAALKRLRNLRRFVYKDYTGKSAAFIREDLEARIEEYRKTTRLWGLPLQKGVLEIAMSTDAVTAATAMISLILFGAPIAAAAAAGGTIAIGKFALTLAQRKRDIELEQAKNPIAYLAEVRRLQRP